MDFILDFIRNSRLTSKCNKFLFITNNNVEFKNRSDLNLEEAPLKKYNIHGKGSRFERFTDRFKLYIDLGIINVIALFNNKPCYVHLPREMWFEISQYQVMLYKYQKEIVKHVVEWENKPHVNIRGGILAPRMGLGKTLISLELCKSTYQNEPTLVICEKNVIPVWIKEIKRFYGNKLTYLVLHKDFTKDSKKVKQKELSKYHIILTTYEFVMSCFDVGVKCYQANNKKRKKLNGTYTMRYIMKRGYKIRNVVKNKFLKSSKYNPLYRRKWFRIIIDEAQKIGSKSKLSESIIALYGERYLALTATPVMNRNLELCNIFKFLGFNTNRLSWDFKYNLNNLESRIYQMSYKDTGKYDKREEIKLTHNHTHIVETSLNKKEVEVYNDIIDKVDDYVATFNSDVTPSIISFNYLRRCASCCYSLGNSGRNVNFELKKSVNDFVNSDSALKSSKFVEMGKIIHNILTSTKDKVVVFSTYKVLLTCFEKYLGIRKEDEDVMKNVLLLTGDLSIKERITMLKKFRKSDCRILLANEKIASTGVDLTCANHIFFMDPHWNAAMETQALARCRRPNQRKETHTYYMISNPSIDAYVLGVQRKKIQQQGKLFDLDITNYMEKEKNMSKELIKSMDQAVGCL